MPTDETPGEEHAEGLNSLEIALRQLTPQGGQIDRDRLMYLAGQASAMNFDSQISPARNAPRVRHSQNSWRLATAALALVSIALGGLLLRSTPRENDVIQVEPPRVAGEGAVALYPPADLPMLPSAVGHGAEYFQLRNLVLTRGIDGLRESSVAGRPATSKSTLLMLPALRQELLGPES
ncbi:MAG TPA: hypothetical protein VMJ32_10485 [Pirellulales bacterium]|nr:hypothetical protein [Pirellulales bacterium]